MLNVGIIGDIKLLETDIDHIRKKPNVQVIGKSSVGTHVQSEKFRFTIPEFNRVELIDRSDVLLINNFSILRFSVLCDIIKKSKHIFTTVYPDLSVEECVNLVKLTNEAKTLFQFTNPFLHLPAVSWLRKNMKYPAYFDISYFNNQPINDLLKLLSMIKGLTGIVSKKVNAVHYKETGTQSEFKNIRFQHGDATVVNLNFGKSDVTNEFTIKVYSDDQFITFDFDSKSFLCNNKSIDLELFSAVSEIDIFIEKVNGKNIEVTDIEDYLTIIEAVQEINKKLSQFSDK